jgi:hypothetical protein
VSATSTNASRLRLTRPLFYSIEQDPQRTWPQLLQASETDVFMGPSPQWHCSSLGVSLVLGGGTYTGPELISSPEGRGEIQPGCMPVLLIKSLSVNKRGIDVIERRHRVFVVGRGRSLHSGVSKSTTDGRGPNSKTKAGLTKRKGNEVIVTVFQIKAYLRRNLQLNGNQRVYHE